MKNKDMTKYEGLTLLEMIQIVDKLGGVEGARNFLKGEVITKACKKHFKPWKTIKVGIYKNSTDICLELKKAGFSISDWAMDMIKKEFRASFIEREIRLVKITPADLGFPKGVTIDEFSKKAHEFGFELCPNEIGPLLRLQYKDQHRNEVVHIMMEPIKIPNGGARIFAIKQEHTNKSDIMELDSVRYGAEKCHEETPFVFCFHE